MVTTKRQDHILAALRAEGGASRENIERYLLSVDVHCSKVTLLRDLEKLVAAGLVERSGTGRATTYAVSARSSLLMPVDVRDYFSKEADERRLKRDFFNFDIFSDLHHLLTPQELEEIDTLNATFRQNRARLTPKLLQKEFERLTVELAWKSSRIEGNTYTLLDTERLLKENIAAEGKTAEETRMVINHKKALEYVLESPAYYRGITVPKIEEIHALLTDGLGVTRGIRTGMVGIIGTNYRPLDNRFQIREALEKLAERINTTENSTEKALIAVLMVSYIQPFEDGNKRTARILGNAILLAGDCCPLSYRSVDEVEYKKGIVLFYEQNNISYFKQLFLEQVRMAVSKYF